MSDYPYFSRYGQYVYCNGLLTRLQRHKSEINLIFPIKLFSYKTKISIS